MAFADELAELKRNLQAADISVGELLGVAGVNRSTWTRWNNDTFRPRFQSWAEVQSAAERLISGREPRKPDA